MDYRVVFSEEALNDLAEIIERVALDDEAAASRFGESLLDYIDLLGRFPHMGNVVRKRSSVRRLVHSPILVYYRIDEDRRMVDVLNLRHGARRPQRF